MKPGLSALQYIHICISMMFSLCKVFKYGSLFFLTPIAAFRSFFSHFLFLIFIAQNIAYHTSMPMHGFSLRLENHSIFKVSHFFFFLLLSPLSISISPSIPSFDLLFPCLPFQMKNHHSLFLFCLFHRYKCKNSEEKKKHYCKVISAKCLHYEYVLTEL